MCLQFLSHQINNYGWNREVWFRSLQNYFLTEHELVHAALQSSKFVQEEKVGVFESYVHNLNFELQCH